MSQNRRSRVRLVALALSAAVLLGGCGSPPEARRSTVDYPPIVVEPAAITPESWSRRGEIVTAEPIGELEAKLSDAQARATRATYASVSAITGQSTNVTGAFFVPSAAAPDGGWPAIALAHGTTGASTGCALSTEPDLRGDATLVAALLDAGYAVAVTDYEGLGPEGSHPYLEPRTAAFNVIDSVRALRAIDPSVSARWLAYGVSQGGQASWAAAEFADWYADDLELVGAVGVAPAANVVGFSELAYRRELSREQLMLAPMLIAGLARYDPTITPGAYLRGAALSELESLIGCGPGAATGRAQLDQRDVGPTTSEEATVLTEALRRIALPQRSSSAPLYLVNGLRDQLVLPQWISDAVARSCELDVSIEHHEVADAGHSDISAGTAVWDWVDDRFAGVPAESNCS